MIEKYLLIAAFVVALVLTANTIIRQFVISWNWKDMLADTISLAGLLGRLQLIQPTALAHTITNPYVHVTILSIYAMSAIYAGYAITLIGLYDVDTPSQYGWTVTILRYCTWSMVLLRLVCLILDLQYGVGAR